MYIGILKNTLKHISGGVGDPRIAESTASESHGHTASVASSDVLAAKPFAIATYLCASPQAQPDIATSPSQTIRAKYIN